MLLFRLIVTLAACWFVKCDLLDLYVQHMDETMRTMVYRNKRHPVGPAARRIKRNLEEDEPLLKIGNFKKQRLDVDEDWLKQWKAKKRTVFFKNDALDYPNKREENLNPDQHEILSNTKQNLKHSEKKSIVPEDAAENSQFNVSQNPIIEEREETSKDRLIIMENQTNIKELTVEDLEPEEEFPIEDWTDSDEIESEDNSQFEVISENERINSKPFVGPGFKKTPKSWGSRAPKKYFPEKSTKNAKGHVKDEAATRSRRHAKEEVNENVPIARAWKFTRYEKLNENGDVILEWDPSNEDEVVFRVTAKTLGYVGIGFNEKGNMKGADILLAWVDDHTGAVNLLVSRSPTKNFVPMSPIVVDL